jgi:hypothetical protein
MRWCRFPLILMTMAALALPAPAGIIFGRKTKPNPAERVPELIITVKTDKDESKRASAAEELRQYDAATHPDIVPVLIDVLMNDAKPSVRAEAADSLGKIRPISQEAGWALEQALAKDGSARVRMQARYALMVYRWNGYHSPPKGTEPTIVPPKDQPPPLPPPALKGTGPTTVRPRPAGETPPPPLARPADQGPELSPPPG